MPRRIPFRQGVREGLSGELETALAGGKGSASGSRSAEKETIGKFETEERMPYALFRSGNGSRQSRRRALNALREGLMEASKQSGTADKFVSRDGFAAFLFAVNAILAACRNCHEIT